MKRFSNNRSHIFVVYNPGGETHRPVIQITIRPGKRQSEREHLAMQALLHAVKRMQDLTRD